MSSESNNNNSDDSPVKFQEEPSAASAPENRDDRARKLILQEEQAQADTLKEEEAKAAQLDKIKAERAAAQLPAAAAAAAAASAESAAKPKAAKPPLHIHDNGLDAVFAAPAYAVHWVTPQHVAVGGGGGGRKRELPNLLTLLHVPTASWTRGSQMHVQTKFENEDDDDSMLPRGPLFTTEQTLDVFEEAGTLQSCAGDATQLVNLNSEKLAAGATQPPAPSSHDYHFVVTHAGAFSLIRATAALTFVDNGNKTYSPVVTGCRLAALCRVAIERDPKEPDTKVAAMAGGLIFVAQDNSSVAVFRQSTLAQWAQQEGALLQQQKGGDSGAAVAVASTPEEVNAKSLRVCEFPCGGRVCDMKALRIVAGDPNNSNKAAAVSEAIVLALCGRDKVLRVGTFDAAAREFVPLRMLGVADFGFKVPDTLFTGQSVRACDFSPRVRNVYDPSDAGRWIGVAADLCVAIAPARSSMHAARLLITATPRSASSPNAASSSSSSSSSSPLKVSVSVADLCRGDGCADAPSVATVQCGMRTCDIYSPDLSFIVATVQGNIAEFVFRHNNSGSSNGGLPHGANAASFLRRFVQNVHSDAISALAVSPPGALAAKHTDGTVKETRVVVSTNISKRIAFHTLDPRSQTTSALRSEDDVYFDLQRRAAAEAAALKKKKKEQQQSSGAAAAAAADAPLSGVEDGAVEAPDLFGELLVWDKPLQPAQLRKTLQQLAALFLLLFIKSFVWHYVTSFVVSFF